MARLIDPRGVRYGIKFDWNVVVKDHKDLNNSIYKDHYYLKYLEYIFTLETVLKKGLLYDSAKVSCKNNKVYVDIYLYDSQYEELESVFGEKTKNYYKIKLIAMEKLILLSILKYYGLQGEVTYYILDNKTISSEGLARFIGIKLMQGFQLGEAVADITKNLDQLLVDKNNELNIPLIKGYRISCTGRFTRRQRTSYKNYKEGNLSLNMVDSFIDYGSKEVYLRYGACTIKVWLNKYYVLENYKKKIKI